MNTVCTADIVGGAIVRPELRYVAAREAGENTVEAREESMRAQLAGASSAVTADEAAAALAAAQRDLAEGRGAGYGVGFGYVKNFGSPRGLDGIRLEYALTDGDRVANLHVIISGGPANGGAARARVLRAHGRRRRRGARLRLPPRIAQLRRAR
jgi:hypothetical protein